MMLHIGYGADPDATEHDLTVALDETMRFKDGRLNPKKVAAIVVAHIAKLEERGITL